MMANNDKDKPRTTNNGKHKHRTKVMEKLKKRHDAFPDKPGFKRPGSVNPRKQA